MIPPDYSIDGVHFAFSSYMYKKYCEAKGIELEDLLKQVKTMLDEGKGFKTAEFPDILLAAHQSYCIYNKLPFTATELDAYGWLDKMGGIVNGVPGRLEVFKIFLGKLLNIDPGMLQTEVVNVGSDSSQESDSDEQKKSSPGESSM